MCCFDLKVCSHCAGQHQACSSRGDSSIKAAGLRTGKVHSFFCSTAACTLTFCWTKLPCPSCRLTAVDHDGVLQASYQGLIRDLSSAEALLFIIAGDSNQPAAVHHSQGTVAFTIDGRCSRQQISSSKPPDVHAISVWWLSIKLSKAQLQPCSLRYTLATSYAVLPEQFSLCRRPGSLALRLYRRG